MSALQASRTLVKSPPELWAELSDLEALARHLGEFGEIRITKSEPETRVEWEADRASGTVRLEPSGWGTRVVLTVETPDPVLEATIAGAPGDVGPMAGATPAASEAETSRADVEPSVAEVEPSVADVEPSLAEVEPSVPEVEPSVADVEPSVPEVEPPVAEAAADGEPGPAPARAAAKRGFFARLFGRAPKPTSAPAREPASTTDAPAADHGTEPPEAVELMTLEPDPEPVEPDRSFATIEWETPVARKEEPPPAPSPPPSPEEAHAVLTGVLDTLGAAHHRPFSRP